MNQLRKALISQLCLPTYREFIWLQTLEKTIVEWLKERKGLFASYLKKLGGTSWLLDISFTSGSLDPIPARNKERQKRGEGLSFQISLFL